MGAMKISDIARLSDVSVSTLREWERRGLLSPAYSPQGTRTYVANDLAMARRIQSMRSFKRMSVAEIEQALRDEPPAHLPPAPPDADEWTIGPKLRRLRLAVGITLKALAVEIGVEPSLLSSLERTSLGLDIPVLQRIAAFHGTTLNALMGIPPTVTAGENMVRKGDAVPLLRLGAGLRIEMLSGGADTMDCQRWTIEPGVHSNGCYRHNGEEFLVVSAGTFEVTIEEERAYQLSAGDSMYFKSEQRHSWRNPGSGATQILWICAGNSF